MKTCSKCRVGKDEVNFAKCSDNRDGLQRWCRVCRDSVNARRYAENKAEEQEKSRNRYWKNPEKAKSLNRDYRRNFPKKVSATYMSWRQANPTYYSDYNNRRYRSEPSFRLSKLLRNRVYTALKIGKGRKTAGLNELLGCPVAWLEVHLESYFRPGMTRENQGTVWHIDHIKPCAKFDLTDPEQQKACFHWTNIQPLFALENMSKGAKYNG